MGEEEMGTKETRKQNQRKCRVRNVGVSVKMPYRFKHEDKDALMDFLRWATCGSCIHSLCLVLFS